MTPNERELLLAIAAFIAHQTCGNLTSEIVARLHNAMKAVEQEQ